MSDIKAHVFQDSLDLFSVANRDVSCGNVTFVQPVLTFVWERMIKVFFVVFTKRVLLQPLDRHSSLGQMGAGNQKVRYYIPELQQVAQNQPSRCIILGT